MDKEKIGKMLKNLRLEKNMTQQEVAARLNVSDKAISKWECAQGLPDISYLNELAVLYNVTTESLLNGEVNPNESVSGNLNKTKFYVCDTCHNIITQSGNAQVYCCGKKLEDLIIEEKNTSHEVTCEVIDDKYYYTFKHEMTKKHYISFIATIKTDKINIYKLYPEQNASIILPKEKYQKIYFYCSKDGLFRI